jgi:Kdo2-lipid IVA lauroyltransferase/acyltransferase
MKILKYFFQAFFIYLFFIISKLCGLSISRKIFSFIFKVIGPLIRSDKVIKKNLKIFNNDITQKEIDKIKSDMWKNYGMTFVEYVFLNKFSKEENHIKIIGGDILNKIIKINKPVIFISGHFANFELMSMELTKNNISLATIYRPLNNLFLNPFMEYLRKNYICKNQIKKGLTGVKETIDFINKGFSIALMIDQRVSEGVNVNFFNKQALTTSLPAQLSLKYNLDIIPISIERKSNNFFEMQILAPVEASKYSEKLELTKKLNNILEDMIRKNPGQWIWTHNRWK